MTNKKIKGLLFSTAILATLGGVSVNSFASEIDQEPVTPEVEYIAPEVNETPAPVVDQEEPSIIEETEPILEQAPAPNVEPETVETLVPVNEPISNETIKENQESEVTSAPNKESEEDNDIEPVTPAPVENVKEAGQATVVEQIEERELVQPNPEKVISQEKIMASDLNGAGNYQISATGTGKIIIYVGRKTVESGGVTGEISGIYSINVVNGQIDAQDLYLLSLAEDSYLYGTGNVTFEISPYIEPETPVVTETEEEKETPAPEQEKPAVEQENEKPVEPKDEEKEVVQKSEVNGKFVGLFESEKNVGKTAEVYYDSTNQTLNFKGTGYYFNTGTPAPASIKIIPNLQKRVLILDTMYQLTWEGNELVSIKAENQGYSSQDDEINDQLSKYPVFSKVDENDYEAEAMKKYEYLNIDDKNIKEENGFYDAEKLGFYYTNTSFGLDIKNLALGASTETALRVKGIKLPAGFLKTKIYQQEIGKLHYAYSFFKGSQRGGYDLVVIYFRLEADGTLTVVRDFHSILTKGARYADIFAKVEMEPTIEPEQPATPVKPEEPETPTKPAPEEPKRNIEEKVETTEVKGKGVTPANELNHEPAKKIAEIKPEKEDAAPIKTENVKADENEEDVPETGNTFVNSNLLASIGVAISTLGTAIFKFKK